MENVQCKKCSETKPIDSFWWMWKKKGIRRKVCIDCSKKGRKENQSPSNIEDTECSKCHVTKHPTEFQPHSKQCRACIAKYLRDRRKTLGREITTEPRNCRRCQTVKAPIDFRRSKDSVGGIRRVCRECEGLPLKKNLVKINE